MKKKSTHQMPPDSYIITEQKQEYVTRIKHSVNPGDLIGAMGAIKKFHDVTKRKVIVSQSTSMLAAYYQGAVHPTMNEQGQNVCCNDAMWDMLKPLINHKAIFIHLKNIQGKK